MPATTKLRRHPPRVPNLNEIRTFSPNSPLTDPNKIDIRLFLTKCMSDKSWECYTVDEKQQILRSLPGSVKSQLRRQYKSRVDDGQDEGLEHTGAQTEHPSCTRASDVRVTDELAETLATAPLTAEFILSDDYLKRQIARFRRDIANGYYQKTWQNQACRAQQDVADGKLDEYLRLYAEELFIDEPAPSEDELGACIESSDEEFREQRTAKRQRLIVT